MRHLCLAVLVCFCTVPAAAQHRFGRLRATYDASPRPGSIQSLRFASNELEFDMFLWFAHDPSTGPIPRRCFYEPDPTTCWPRFLGPFVAGGSFRGGVDFRFVAPARSAPLPFFGIAVDRRTMKYTGTPIETYVFRIPFRHVTIDASNPTDPHCKTLGDIDGDGFLDALAASSSGGAGLFWYDWAKGWKKHRIATGNFSVDMQVADLDGDGDLDVVIPSTTNARLMWYENPRPGGDPRTAAWPARAIGRSTFTHDVEVGDIDGDDDIDVVTREKFGRWTSVWINSGRGASFSEVVVHKRKGEGTALGDLDGDGDLDIAHNGFWVETPQDLARGSWTVRTIDASWPPDVGVTIADLNRDGRADVLLAPSESSNGKLVWYEGPASPRTGGWKPHVIGTGVSFMHTFKAADMDGDGDLDVVTAEMHQSRNRYVSVWINHDDAASWTREIVATTGSHNLRVGDIGGDGDIDIFGANWNRRSPTHGRIEIWENRLEGFRKPRLRLDRWARRVIDPRKPWRGVFVAAGDLDGDRFPDVVTGGHWYRNPGQASGKWSRRTIGGALYNVATVTDFDSDGDLDLLGTNGKVIGSRFEWARNDGRGGFTLLGNIPSGTGNFLQGVAVARFARASGTPCQVALSWHTTSAGVQLLDVPADPSATAWKIRRLSPVSQDEGLSVGDVDRDGDRDLLLGTRWLRNDGSSFTAFTIHAAAGSPDRNRLADINGDGRLDAVVGYEAASAPERVAWYEQPVNPTGAWTEHVIARITGPMSLDVADMDNDGDIDVVAGEHDLRNPAAARVIVFENLDGRGRRWQWHVVYRGDEHHDGTRIVDIDRDGDLDIVSIGWRNPAVVVYENLAAR